MHNNNNFYQIISLVTLSKLLLLLFFFRNYFGCYSVNKKFKNRKKMEMEMENNKESW